MNYMGVLITRWGILTILIYKHKNLAGEEKRKRLVIDGKNKLI